MKDVAKLNDILDSHDNSEMTEIGQFQVGVSKNEQFCKENTRWMRSNTSCVVRNWPGACELFTSSLGTEEYSLLYSKIAAQRQSRQRIQSSFN